MRMFEFVYKLLKEKRSKPFANIGLGQGRV